jgi:hypothetical protein
MRSRYEVRSSIHILVRSVFAVIHGDSYFKVDDDVPESLYPEKSTAL